MLEVQLGLLDKSQSVLEYSYHRCLSIKDKSKFDAQDLERFESLTGHRCQPWRANARAGSPQKA